MSNSKMPRTLPKPSDEWETVVIDRTYVQQFFDDDRRKQCRQLITEALLMGEFDQLHREAYQDFMERKANYVNDGVWELFVDECCRRHGGAMTDAAKRQRTPTPDRACGYGPVPTSSPMASHGVSTPWPSPTSSASSTWMISQPPRPTVLPPSYQQLPMLPADMELPPGIVSLTQWGQTVITFGKYAKRKMTYDALAVLEGEEAMSYRGWTMARETTGGPQLKDLAMFFRARQAQGTLGGVAQGRDHGETFHRVLKQ